MLGILGLQGDYAAHGRLFEGLDAPFRIVKKPEQLDQVDGLVLPGGESTTLLKLMEGWDFEAALVAFARAGKPVFGTCAGMILLARQVVNPPQRSLALIDLTVERNSYGRQNESFEGVGTLTVNGASRRMPMVFIRAPRILSLGDGVEALATCGDDVVMARQQNVLAASFHPELTDDLGAHRYFLEMMVAD